MSRFYISPDSVKGSKIYVDIEESHHIRDVMRLKEGDDVTVFDGTGREYSGKIASAKNKNVVIAVDNVRTVSEAGLVRISLAQAVPKKDRMDYIIQKATELGVKEIVPFETERTIARAVKDRAERRMDRWRKIAAQAAKQCGRSDLPDVRQVCSFGELLNCFRGYDAVIMASLTEKAVLLRDGLQRLAADRREAPGTLLLAIGPEGDFTPSEILAAEEKGALLVSLGRLVLKSDTAAVSAIAMLNYVYSA